VKRLALDRRVEELDGVEDRRFSADFPQRRFKLHYASGITSSDDVRLKSGDELSFSLAQSCGCRRLNEVVDSRGAATDWPFRNFEQLDAWDF